jgi:hypothetical protein
MIMKRTCVLILMLVNASSATAAIKDSTVNYSLPDSVKAISFLADITPGTINKKGYFQSGIKTDAVSLFLTAEKNSRNIRFVYPFTSPVVARGAQAREGLKEGTLSFNYTWEEGKTYRLLIATTADSAENFSLYSGYIWLPGEEKWKLIGTCKIAGRWNTIQGPASFTRKSKNNTGNTIVGQVWCQRNTGSWKNLSGGESKSPLVNLASHTDSLYQWQEEKKVIELAIQNGSTDVKQNSEGVYYTIMQEGTGKMVTINDTVTVHYKGYLFSNGTVFDQTREKPATFPLKRLIRGWQICIPLCKVGGKIKLVIPSALAYSIRTRAAKIPPNSILVFEIEVVDTKSPG